LGLFLAIGLVVLGVKGNFCFCFFCFANDKKFIATKKDYDLFGYGASVLDIYCTRQLASLLTNVLFTQSSNGEG